MTESASKATAATSRSASASRSAKAHGARSGDRCVDDVLRPRARVPQRVLPPTDPVGEGRRGQEIEIAVTVQIRDRHVLCARQRPDVGLDLEGQLGRQRDGRRRCDDDGASRQERGQRPALGCWLRPLAFSDRHGVHSSMNRSTPRTRRNGVQRITLRWLHEHAGVGASNGLTRADRATPLRAPPPSLVRRQVSLRPAVERVPAGRSHDLSTAVRAHSPAPARSAGR